MWVGFHYVGWLPLYMSGSFYWLLLYFCKRAVDLVGAEMRVLKDDSYPILERLLMGPIEEESKIFIMERHRTQEVSMEVSCHAQPPGRLTPSGPTHTLGIPLTPSGTHSHPRDPTHTFGVYHLRISPTTSGSHPQPRGPTHTLRVPPNHSEL